MKVDLLRGQPPGRVSQHADRRVVGVPQPDDVDDQLEGDPAGASPAISRSRPTMIVSVWWRAWLQRQNVGSFMFMNDAT